MVNTSIVICVTGLLVCGSLNTITMKIAFTMKSVDSHGDLVLFQKPWFVTFVMFVAMSLALCFDKSIRRCEPCRRNVGAGGGMVALIDKSPGGAVTKDSISFKPSWTKKVVMVSIPAVFDILATGLCSTGFLYIPASVWQLLRGAEMVFAAFFAVMFLGRKLHIYHWLGVFLCTIGIVLVGFASVWGAEAMATEESSEESSSPKVSGGKSGLLLLGMALALGGQVVQAAQVIAEEWLLNDVDLPGPQIIGFEGIWGAVIMILVAFPLLYFIPGSDGRPMEDEVDSFTMLANSGSLLGLVLIYTFSCTTYNMSGIAVTGALSAVHRVMLEALRTAVVWIFGLGVHYLDPESPFGEMWTPYSWIEVGGFVVIILGQGVYGAMIKIPGIEYPIGAPIEAIASPGALRNLASPLPPAEFRIQDDNGLEDL